VSHLIVVDRAGQEHVLQPMSGQTVMEAIREAGLDELLALCGGCCSCATCHIHVDPTDMGALGPISEDEKVMLEESSHFSASSRLSCQIRMNGAALRVTIAPED
jgi:2Fe-2S ferredoxin